MKISIMEHLKEQEQKRLKESKNQPRLSLRERKKIRARELILTVAAREFARHGVRKTSIADIMECCDMGIGTFYNYFSSKEKLLFCLLEGLVEETKARAKKKLSLQCSYREVLEDVMRFTGTLLEENRFVFPLLLSAADRIAKNEDGGEERLAPPEFKDVFLDIISLGQENGEFRTDIAPAICTEMFHSIFQAAAFSTQNISFKENIRLKTQILLDGMAKR